MLRPRPPIVHPFKGTSQRFLRPFHRSAIQLKAKTYKGEPPKKPKPKAKPSSSIGTSQLQKLAVPDKKEPLRQTAVKEKKDPLQGMRQANELGKMVKYPAARAQQLARESVIHELPSKDDQQTKTEGTTTEDSSCADKSGPSSVPSGTAIQSSSLNRRPISAAKSTPSMSSHAPSGAPYVHPLQSTADKAKYIIAAMALTFFVAGAYLAFGPGSNNENTGSPKESAPAGIAMRPPTPKDKPLPANVKRAMELLKAYFKERASSLDEDVGDFTGAGIMGVGGGTAFPRMVVYPERTEEVEIILNICHKYGVGVIPYSGGTSLEGQCVPVTDVITVSLANMNKIIELRPNDMDITLQPGISWTDLNAYLKPYNLFLPVDPGPNAHIGGMISTSASGTNAVRYGTMKDWVLNLTVVLPGGHVMKTGSRARKSSTGYDLTRLFCGSEGTLGIITEVTLKLAHLPEKEVVGSIAFETNTDAAKAVSKLLKSGVEPRCLELLDTTCITAVNSNLPHNIPSFHPKPHLFFKLSGSSTTIPATQKSLIQILKSAGGTDLRVVKTPEEGEMLWDIRKNLLYSLLSMFPGSAVIGTDACVPVSRLAGLIEQYKIDQERINGDIEKEGTEGNEQLKGRKLASLIVGHIGDGNFHSLIAYEKGNEALKEKAQELETSLVLNAIALDGTCSGEHGVGIHKIDFLTTEYDQAAITLMRAIKLGVDPKGIMNPGTLLPGPSGTMLPQTATIDVQTLNEWIVKPKSLEEEREMDPDVMGSAASNLTSAPPLKEGGSWIINVWNGLTGADKKGTEKSEGNVKNVEEDDANKAGKEAEQEVLQA